MVHDMTPRIQFSHNHFFFAIVSCFTHCHYVVMLCGTFNWSETSSLPRNGIQDVPPYFTASSDLCIRVDVYSARCASGIQSDTLFSNTSNDTDDIECSYIESIRFGTYDANGQLYNEGRFGVNRQVTETQKYLLGVSLGICCILAVYSCYLHHAITNLLIKSLSHTDLLPPSRHRRRSGSSRRRGTGRRTRKPLSDEDDEDENFEIQPGATPA